MRPGFFSGLWDCSSNSKSIYQEFAIPSTLTFKSYIMCKKWDRDAITREKLFLAVKKEKIG